MHDPFTPAGLAALLDGQPGFRGRQVTAWLARGVDDPLAMTDLPAALREQVAAGISPAPRVVRVSEADAGLTRKALLACGSDAEAVEAVLMLYPGRTGRQGRATVCVSTQAGCAMGCPFCATGQVGLRRQLSVAEVCRQVTWAQRRLREEAAAGTLADGVPDHVTNVVFMGMGEPLANLEVTVDAVRWLTDPEAFALSARGVTVSTVGLVPGIRRLQALDLPLTLAVSLHAPDDALRDDLVPINGVYPLEELLTASRAYLDATHRRLTFEYVLIAGVNAAPEQAERLAALLRRHIPHAGRHVNLIPYNPTPAIPWEAPTAGACRTFAAVLQQHGVTTTLRRTRGTAIEAACGQLYAAHAAGSGRILPQARGAADRITARATGVARAADLRVAP